MQIHRDGQVVFDGSSVDGRDATVLPRTRGLLVPGHGLSGRVVLLTGTGVVPGSDFTLHEGDRVVVDVAEVGVLSNPVTVVGR